MKTVFIGTVVLFFLFHQAQGESLQLAPLKSPAQKQKKEILPSLDFDLQPLIDFVVEWTSYKYQAQPLPEVRLEKHDLVQIFAYGDLEFAQAEAQGILLAPVNAVYDSKRKTIYISDRLATNSSSVQVALVHELVHYLQDINGYTESLNGHYECTESEAYDVQMLWQILNKVDEQEIPYVQERSLLWAMKCMGDISAAFGRKK